MARERREAAVARAQAAGARLETGVDEGLSRVQPVLTLASRGLGGLGRVVAVASLVGGVGAALLAFLGVRSFGWAGLAFGLSGLAPWAGWRVGRRAVRGARLLGDARRVVVAVKASGQSGRQWLDHMAGLAGAARRGRGWGVARSAVGAGRSLWQALGPDVEGADDLRSLALWPRTLTMAALGLTSPILVPIALLWATLAVLF